MIGPYPRDWRPHLRPRFFSLAGVLGTETRSEPCRGRNARRAEKFTRLSGFPSVHIVTGGGLGVSMTEQRCLRRFKLVVPVLYRWTDQEQRYDVGCSRDISSAGIFIVSARCPPLHSSIDVEVVFPACDPLTSEVRLRCAGQVVRVQVSDNATGFGFAVVGPF